MEMIPPEIFASSSFDPLPTNKSRGSDYLDFLSTGITSRAGDQRKEPSIESVCLTLWQVLWKRVLFLKVPYDMFRVSFHCREYQPKVFLPVFAYA